MVIVIMIVMMRVIHDRDRDSGDRDHELPPCPISPSQHEKVAYSDSDNEEARNRYLMLVSYDF